MTELRFTITEYIDGTYKIETHHLHYAFRDDLLYDNIKPKDLGKTMSKIADTVNNKYKLSCKFVID